MWELMKVLCPLNSHITNVDSSSNLCLYNDVVLDVLLIISNLDIFNTLIQCSDDVEIINKQ